MYPELKIAEKYIKKELSPLSFGRVSVTVIANMVLLKYTELVESIPINKSEYDQFGIPVHGILNAATQKWEKNTLEIPFDDFLIWWLQNGNVDEALDWFNWLQNK